MFLWRDRTPLVSTHRSEVASSDPHLLQVQPARQQELVALPVRRVVPNPRVHQVGDRTQVRTVADAERGEVRKMRRDRADARQQGVLPNVEVQQVRVAAEEEAGQPGELEPQELDARDLVALDV